MQLEQLLLCSLVAATINAQAQLPFASTYGGAMGELAGKAAPLADGGFLLTGPTYSFGQGGADLFAIRISDEGAVNWSIGLGDAGEDEGWAVAARADGSALIGGRTTSDGNGGYDGLVVRTAPDGTVLWQRLVGGSGSEQVDAITALADGSWCIAGPTNSITTSGTNGWIMRMADDGTLLWQRQFRGLGNISVNGLTDLDVAADDHLWAVGSVGGTILLVKLDLDGDTVWTHRYGASPVLYGRSVRTTADGGAIVTGYQLLPPPAGGLSPIWLKVDAGGTPQWVRRADATVGSVISSYLDALPASDGGYTFTMSVQPSGRPPAVYMVRTDANGDSLWTRTYSKPEGIILRHAVPGPDDGALLFAQSSWIGGPGWELVAIRTDADGNNGNGCIEDHLVLPMSTPVITVARGLTLPPSALNSVDGTLSTGPFLIAAAPLCVLTEVPNTTASDHRVIWDAHDQVIRIRADHAGKATVRLLDPLGRLIAQHAWNYAAGEDRFMLPNTGQSSASFHVLQVITEQGGTCFKLIH